MSRDYLDLLEDIVEHSKYIIEFIGNKTVREFESNKESLFATIRAFEIIGEAARRIPDEIKDKYPQIEWSKIIAMRNKLAHDYDMVSYEVVWQTGKLIIPELILKIEKIITELK